MLWLALLIARGEQPIDRDLSFALPIAVIFHAAVPSQEAVVLAPGRYFPMWSQGSLTFLREGDALDAGRLAVTPSELKKPKPSGVEVKIEKKKITLTIVIAQTQIVLHGEPTTIPTKAPASVPLGESESASLPANLPGADDPVVQSWLRLKSQIVHCSDHATRSGWSASDEKYQRCVCPLALDFRMPGIGATRRFALDHQVDVALTIDSAGKVTTCELVAKKK